MFLFKDALIFDGLGNEPVCGDLLVEGERIKGLTGATVPAGGAMETIECQGMSLLPGFMNCHVHLGMDAGPFATDTLVSGGSNAALLRGVANARRMLLAGFTTVRDCGGLEDEVLVLRDGIARGAVAGPRIVSCGRAILPSGGHFCGYVADSPAEVRRSARLALSQGADFIKVMATGGLGRPGQPIGKQELFYDELHEAFAVARLARLTSAAHCHGLAGIRDSIRAGATSIEHATFLDEEAARQMAEKGMFLVPTFGAYEIMVRSGPARGLPSDWIEYAEFILAAKYPRFKYAIDVGVKLAFGTDAGSPVNPHDDLLTEAQAMLTAGVNPLTILRSLTSWSAELLQLDDVTGSIEPGKLADLVLVEGNPAEDISALGRVRLVMKEGKIVRREGL